MVCACFLGGGDGGKHEGMIIKNINWLQKKLCFSTFSTLHPPLRCGSTYQHGGGGGIWIKTT